MKIIVKTKWVISVDLYCDTLMRSIYTRTSSFLTKVISHHYSDGQYLWTL